MKQITLNTLREFSSGYHALNDNEQLRCIQDYVARLPEIEDDAYPFALILVTAIVEGTNPKTLADFCGMPLDFVTEIANRMTASGLWLDDGSVDYDFFTAQTGRNWDIRFVVNLSVAQGLLAWTGETRNGNRVYQLTEAGLWDLADHSREKSSLTQ